jgi:hypothetical protein
VSALLVSGERSLAVEFPADALAADVLRAIGGEERTFTESGRRWRGGCRSGVSPPHQ